MTRNKIASLLARLAMCLTLCLFSCEKPANTLVIDKPNLKPQTGTGTGNGNGTGSGSGSGNGSGTGGW